MTSSQKPPRRPKPQAVAQLQACLVVAFQALYSLGLRAQVAGAYSTGVFGSLQHVVVKGSLRHAGRVDTENDKGPTCQMIRYWTLASVVS